MRNFWSVRLNRRNSIQNHRFTESTTLLNLRVGNLLHELEAEYLELKDVRTMTDLEITYTRNSKAYCQDSKYRELMEKKIAASSRKSGLKATISNLKFALFNTIRVEMDPVAQQEHGTQDTVVTQETLKDNMGDGETKAPTFSHQTDDFDPEDFKELKDFLSRPVRIHSADLTLNARNETVINPWNLFLSAPSVRAKLRNFAYLRGDLHIRVAFSATPFHYGRVMMAYCPTGLYNSVFSYWTGNIGAGVQAFPAQERLFYCWLSQFYGAKSLDIKTNQPYEFVCPFVCPAVMGRLYNQGSAIALASGSTIPDFSNMGSIVYGCLNPIQSNAVGSTDPNMYVYAWMENVVLAVPTGSQMVITTEMDRGKKKKKDERVSGPVETLASNMIPVANALSTVPVIGPWAMASSIALKSLQSFASLLGWSYPNKIEPAIRVKNEPFQNGGNVIGMDTGKRITLDPKQEVTVDPRLYGMQHDDMDLNHLSEIESYLDTFTWTPAAVALVPIQVYGVNPMTCPAILNPVIGSRTVVQPTALAFAAKPFQFWNGDIEFRFEIVASSFVRGKFIIGFEPNISQLTLITANLGLNKQSYVVVDIQDTDSVSVCVPWAFHSPYALTARDADLRRMTGLSTTTNLEEVVTGFIFVAPLTELQSPDGSSVSVNVYIKGKNMSFVYPDYNLLPRARNFSVALVADLEEKISHGDDYLISTEMDVLAEYDEKNLNDENVTCKDLVDVRFPTRHAAMTCYGEVVKSFRSLLKRFAGNSVVTSTVAITPPGTYQIQIPAFPMQSLIQGGTLASTIDQTTLFNYLQDAYLGHRGGIRHRFRLLGPKLDDPNTQIRVTLGSPSGFQTTMTINASSVFGGVSKGVGSVEFVPMTNGGIEFEVPYYSNSLFQIPGPNNNGPQSSFWQQPAYMSVVSVFYDIPTTPSTTNLVAISEVAAAEDFSFGHYMSAYPYIF